MALREREIHSKETGSQLYLKGLEVFESAEGAAQPSVGSSSPPCPRFRYCARDHGRSYRRMCSWPLLATGYNPNTPTCPARLSPLPPSHRVIPGYSAHLPLHSLYDPASSYASIWETPTSLKVPKVSSQRDPLPPGILPSLGASSLHPALWSAPCAPGATRPSPDHRSVSFMRSQLPCQESSGEADAAGD